jgi:hypothetical protein
MRQSTSVTGVVNQEYNHAGFEKACAPVERAFEFATT